jgi:hypothetical protein
MLVLAAACAGAVHCGYPTFGFDGGGGAGGAGSSSHQSSTSHASSSHASTTGAGGAGVIECQEAHQAIGCCDTSGNVVYCLDGETVKTADCEGLGCGWNPGTASGTGDYDCAYIGPDPSGKYPMNCPNGI